MYACMYMYYLVVDIKLMQQGQVKRASPAYSLADVALSISLMLESLQCLSMQVLMDT